ncbi:Hypothetical protein KVN_LOCUS5 [uncultured virus]|nr:Hypothetical protein KVN_LOCUS5 [uncultured virus]
MENLKRILLNINFRDDYNGKPNAYIINNHLIVKTHPFYTFGFRSGRCYRYDIIDIVTNKIIKNFSLYCYNGWTSFIDIIVFSIYNDIKNRIFLRKYLINEKDFIIINHDDRSQNFSNYLCLEFVETNKSNIIKEFQTGNFDKNAQGFIIYNENIYLLKSNLDHKNSIYTKDYYFDEFPNKQPIIQNSIYYQMFIEKLQDLPHKNYTNYNKKCNSVQNTNKIFINVDDSEEYPFYANYVKKNDKIIGQVFSSPGMIDILFIDEY